MPPLRNVTASKVSDPYRARASRAVTICAVLVATFCGILLLPSAAHAGGLVLSPAAKHALDTLYAGQTTQSIREFQQIEEEQPESPVGYLGEAEARWWQIYCEACEIKWNMLDAWRRPSRDDDDIYLALTDKTIHPAEDHISHGDSAEMELWAGMGWLLRARLLGLRDERRATAQAGVQGRARMLRCLQLDPEMADADAGLGLYNYYVDTLSGIARALRFLMGIPGGKRQDGIHQLEIAMEQGTFTRVEARFYLAKNLRNYDRDYAMSIEVISPLATEYPQNPIFQLILGDTHAKLAQWQLAASNYRAAEQLPIPDAACAERVRELVRQALMSFAADSSHSAQ
jgi:hypothetical protein